MNKISRNIVNGPTHSAGKPWFTIKNASKKEEAAEILIFENIGKDWWSGEGVGAKEFSEALKQIPDEQHIKVKINSRGGNVYDGLAIYNELRQRKGRVDTYNQGLAGSIASIILLATANGGKVHMAKAAQIMIHDPSTYAEGDIAAMQQAITRLEAAKDSLLIAYEEKTKRTKAELSSWMQAETWMTGEKAKDNGFVDELTEDVPIFNNLDLSSFRNVPDSIRKLNNTAPAGGLNTAMNRKQIMARLKKMGIVEDLSALTDEQLVARLETEMDALEAKAKTPPKVEPEPSAPTDAVTNRLKEVENQLAAERGSRFETAIDNAIAERRIPAAQKKQWVTRAKADETILDDIKNMPQQLPPAGVNAECVSEALDDICNHAIKLHKQARHHMQRGDEKEAAALIKARGQFALDHRERAIKAWDHFPILNEGTNTIDSDLKQDVLLMDALVEFKKIIMPLTKFAKNIGAVPLRGTTTIRVPFIPNDTVASTAWNASNGYVGGDTAVEEKSLTLARYYKAIRYTSDELRRQPYLMLNDTFRKAAEKLAYDVWIAWLAIITAANYDVTVTGAAASGVATGWPLAAAAFDSNVVANLRNSANLSQWPFIGRVLIVNSDYDTNLLKDNAIKNAMAFGTNAAVVDGMIQKIFGFEYGTNPNWPTNSENLVGIIAEENAVLIGSSPIAPDESQIRAGLLYSVIADPDLGISLEYKDFGQPQMDRQFRVLEANYAVGAGNKKNLYRLTSA
jgi:ATP-dependent Clp protease protease subunit